jgi:DNA polymerase-1
LKPWKQTSKAGDSTDNSVLESYRGNAVVDALLEYQEVNKLLTTYVDAYLGTNDKPSQIYDEHIHAQYKQYGTVTGRLSCSDPNIQNIPGVDTDLGAMIRGAFIAEEGGKLIVSDYSQVELVILAHYLGCGKLFEGFLAGIDPHTQTSIMLDQPRQVCKKVNFAVLYGVGVRKLAGILKLPEKEVRAIVARHKKEFPETYAFKDALLRLCRSRNPPHIRTLYGRKRRVPLINDPDPGLRAYSERQAFNSLIQGTSADITKRAMNRADQDPRRGNDIKLVFSVHDEIGLSAPAHKADLAAEILQEAMVGKDMQRLKISLKADIHIVDRWSEAKG